MRNLLTTIEINLLNQWRTSVINIFDSELQVRGSAGVSFGASLEVELPFIISPSLSTLIVGTRMISKKCFGWYPSSFSWGDSTIASWTETLWMNSIRCNTLSQQPYSSDIQFLDSWVFSVPLDLSLHPWLIVLSALEILSRTKYLSLIPLKNVFLILILDHIPCFQGNRMDRKLQSCLSQSILGNKKHQNILGQIVLNNRIQRYSLTVTEKIANHGYF